MKVRRRGRRKTKSLHITMPKGDIDDLDELAEETDLSRSEVLQNIIGYVLSDDDLKDQIFGEVDEEAESESEEEEDND